MRSCVVAVLIVWSGLSRAAPPPKGEIDSGTFEHTSVGVPVTVEEFSITRTGDRLVLRSKAAAPSRKDWPDEGELETDAAFHPIRASFRELTTKTRGRTITLGGKPLTFDITRDDNQRPVHTVATGPLDVYLGGSSAVLLTPMCKVTGDVLWSSLGEDDSPWRRHVEAYRAAPVGKLTRVVVDAEVDYELLCDGDRLITGGQPRRDTWFVRKGREGDLDALKAAARPPRHAWKLPVDDAEPWRGEGVKVVGNRLVIPDFRRHMQRLTSYDPATGAAGAHREIRTRNTQDLLCNSYPGKGLVCHDLESGFYRLIDGTTLADIADLGALVTRAAASSKSEDWLLVRIDGPRIWIKTSDTQAVEIDLDKQSAKLGELPRDGLYQGSIKDRCVEAFTGLTVGGEHWEIQQGDAPSATLVRTAGKKALPGVALALNHPKLLECARRGGGAYAVTHEAERSVIVALDKRGKISWKTSLPAEPGTVWTVDGKFIIDLKGSNVRAVAIDPASGKPLWTASPPK